MVSDWAAVSCLDGKVKQITVQRGDGGDKPFPLT